MSNINYMYAALHLHLGPVPGVAGLVVVVVVGVCRGVAAAPVTAAVSALRSDQSNQGSELSCRWRILVHCCYLFRCSKEWDSVLWSDGLNTRKVTQHIEESGW